MLKMSSARLQLVPRLALNAVLIVAALQQMAPASGFLFPDLKFRTGSSGSPKYRIAAIQEEPYMSANGSGYLPEVVREVSQAYHNLHPGDEALRQLDVVSVHSWQQLMSRARSSRWQLALGLVIPSLDLTGWSGRQLQTSAPVVYTTLKMVTRRQRPAAAAAAAAAAGAEWDAAAEEGMMELSGAAAPRRQAVLSDRTKVLVLRGSPIEYLLIRGNSYRGPVQPIDNVDQAVRVLLSSADDVALLTDAIVADHLAGQHAGELESVCPSKLGGSGWLYYAFFGRDTATIAKLNEAIASMTTDDSLLGLYSKRIGSQVQHCPY